MSDETTRPGWLPQALRWGIILLMPVVIVMTNVRIMLTDVFVVWEYNRPSFPPDILGQWTAEDRVTYGLLARDYLLNSASIDYLAYQVFPDGARYNQRELKHMADVKVVTQNALLVWKVVLAGVVAAAWVLIRTPATRPLGRSALMWGGGLVLIILTLLLGYIALSFNSFFTQFHNVFFEEGTWLFYIDDVLIRQFPLEFWFDIFVGIAVMSVVEALALIGLSAWLLPGRSR